MKTQAGEDGTFSFTLTAPAGSPVLIKADPYGRVIPDLDDTSDSRSFGALPGTVLRVADRIGDGAGIHFSGISTAGARGAFYTFDGAIDRQSARAGDIVTIEGNLGLYLGRQVEEYSGFGPDGRRLTALFLTTEPAREEGRVGDREILIDFWRTRAREWWSSRERSSAICDGCNGSVLRGEGYLHQSSLLCEGCCEARTDASGMASLAANPDYFGTRELVRARELAETDRASNIEEDSSLDDE